MSDPTPIQRFEDPLSWQKVRALTSAAYRLKREGPFTRDFGLRDQGRRYAVSIMANIAEGFERGRPNEFHQFLSGAKASRAEVRTHLCRALDAGYIDQEQFNLLTNFAVEVGRITGGLRVSVERRKATQHS